ncbi:MAG: PAS domain S-box protein [Deltaproteobacteria bacterium]|nr:PAS domain S-box protein [Deltaproteobacteria bacterium]
MSRLSAILAAMIGVGAVVGWLVHVPFLYRPLHSLPAMMPASASSAALLGAALLILARKEDKRRTRCWVAFGACGLVAIIAVAMLVQLAFLLGAPSRTLTGMSGMLRPSPITAGAFVLLASSLLTLDVGLRRGIRPAEILALAGAIPALAAWAGYIYGATVLYGTPAPPPAIGTSPLAALAQLLLALGILCARPESGVVSVLTSELEGGRAARRLLLGALAIPLMGLAILMGQEAGLYPNRYAMALLAIFAFVIALMALVVTARWLNRADAERRAGELERAQLATIVSSSDDTIVATDLDGIVVHWNSAAERQYGWSAKEMIGRHISAIVPLDLRTELGPIFEAIRAGGHIECFETIRKRKDGSLLDISLTLSPIVDPAGRVAGVSGIGRDIRQRKAAEAELRRAHGSELSAMLELERLREEWATVVAHDLRQPLTAISLSLDLLRTLRAREPLSATEAKALARIDSAARGLRRMVDDLSDASRIEAKRLTLEPREVDLARLVVEVCDQSEVRCICRVETDGRTAVADPERITQVLTNLLNNAAKYGAAGEPIAVVVTGNDRETEVSVSNRGPGIPGEELPELFDRFKRARAVRDARKEGLGLGLYICKGLIEAHGGRIWVESTPGATTTFHFTLPFGPAKVEHAEQPAASY